MRKKLVRWLLLTIHACDGIPIPEPSLISAVQNLARPEQPTEADIADALKDAQGQGFVSGASEALMERTWTLTTAGLHKARQLR